MNAVRWLTPPRRIAALVVDSGTRSFAAELFNFERSARKITAELYLLARGEYELAVAAKDGDGNGTIERKTFTVSGPRARVSFDLPGRKLCSVVCSGRE